VCPDGSNCHGTGATAPRTPVDRESLLLDEFLDQYRDGDARPIDPE
jgi:hypothetical protein